MNVKQIFSNCGILLNVVASLLFVFYAFYGLSAIDDDCELHREVEHAHRRCENRGSDGATAVVVSSDEINEHKKEIDVRLTVKFNTKTAKRHKVQDHDFLEEGTQTC